MNHSELVSVVIPVFNGAKYLRDTLESVLAQTYRPVEVIVVDDASTDGSSDVAASFGLPVRVLRNERNRERAWSRNRGVAEARGELIAFLDADDLWHPAKLERQVAAMAQDPSIGLCYTGFQLFEDGTDGVRHFGWTQRPGALRDRADRLLVRGNYFGLLTVLLRKSCFCQAGEFDCEPCLITCEDYDLWLRMGRICRFHGIDETLAFYRQHARQSTHNVEKMWTTAALVRWRYIKRYPDVLAGKNREEQWFDRFGELEDKARKALESGNGRVAFRHYLRLLVRDPLHWAWYGQVIGILGAKLVHILKGVSGRSCRS